MSDMFFFERAGLWWPVTDVKHEKCFDFISRNVRELDVGLVHCHKRGIAVQAGAHVGIFPNYLAEKFKKVYAFEPDPLLYRCLALNAVENVIPVPFALSSQGGIRRFAAGPSTGRGAISPSGELMVETFALDEYALAVNYIHFDVERHEVDAMEGATKTIAKYSPVVQLEVLPDNKDKIYQCMMDLGYQLVNDQLRDHVFVRKSGDHS